MRILNLYAGIGGNRALWDHARVEAVEYDRDIAMVYQGRFPEDDLVICDVVDYLEHQDINHFDFVWASPPCQSHGQYRHNVGVIAKGYRPIVPDMTQLYGIIMFLNTYYKGLYCVENTVPYYQPLIPPTAKLQRHLFWTNFPLSDIDITPDNIRSKNAIGVYADSALVENSQIKNKRQVLRNQTDARLGKHILDCAKNYLTGGIGMPLLGGNKSNLRSNPRAAAPTAKDVRAKVQGSGKVNLAKLRTMQERHTSRNEFYKLQQDGTSRFRIVMPLGNDDIPMVIADQHFLPVADDSGKTSKRAVYCLNSFGLDCPICRLSAMLQNSNDANLIADGQSIRASQRWAMLVVNRDYMANADDPIAEYDTKQEKVVMLFAPKGIGEDIINYMGKKVWSDPQDPETGYDFEVLGKKKGGSSPWPEYTLTPQPREASPSYDINLTKGLKPLSQVVVPNKLEDLDKILVPILMSLAESGEDGTAVVEDFQPLWEDFKAQYENGIIVPESVREDDPDIDAEEAEAYVEEEAAKPAPKAKPMSKPASKPLAKKPVAKKPAPVEEAEEFDGDGAEAFEEGMEAEEYETAEGDDSAPEGGESEGEEYDPDEGAGEDEADSAESEEEPEQPVAPRKASRPAPVAKPAATGTPGIRRPATVPPPAAKGSTDLKSRLANIGKR